MCVWCLIPARSCLTRVFPLFSSQFPSLSFHYRPVVCARSKECAVQYCSAGPSPSWQSEWVHHSWKSKTKHCTYGQPIEIDLNDEIRITDKQTNWKTVCSDSIDSTTAAAAATLLAIFNSLFLFSKILKGSTELPAVLAILSEFYFGGISSNSTTIAAVHSEHRPIKM